MAIYRLNVNGDTTCVTEDIDHAVAEWSKALLEDHVELVRDGRSMTEYDLLVYFKARIGKEVNVVPRSTVLTLDDLEVISATY